MPTTATSGTQPRLLLLLRPPLWSRSLASTRKSKGRSTAPSRKTRSLPRSSVPIRTPKQWNRRFASPGAGSLECCLAWLCLLWPCCSAWALLAARIITPLLLPRLQSLLRLPFRLTEARLQASHQLQFLPPRPTLTLPRRLQLAPLQSRPFLTCQPDQPQPQPRRQQQQLPQPSVRAQLRQSQLLQWRSNRSQFLLRPIRATTTLDRPIPLSHITKISNTALPPAS